MGRLGVTMTERISDDLAWLMFASGALARPETNDSIDVATMADTMLVQFRARFPIPSAKYDRSGAPLNPGVRRKGRVLSVNLERRP